MNQETMPVKYITILQNRNKVCYKSMRVSTRFDRLILNRLVQLTKLFTPTANKRKTRLPRDRKMELFLSDTLASREKNVKSRRSIVASGARWGVWKSLGGGGGDRGARGSMGEPTFTGDRLLVLSPIFSFFSTRPIPSPCRSTSPSPLATLLLPRYTCRARLGEAVVKFYPSTRSRRRARGF